MAEAITTLFAAMGFLCALFMLMILFKSRSQPKMKNEKKSKIIFLCLTVFCTASGIIAVSAGISALSHDDFGYICGVIGLVFGSIDSLVGGVLLLNILADLFLKSMNGSPANNDSKTDEKK